MSDVGERAARVLANDPAAGATLAAALADWLAALPAAADLLAGLDLTTCYFNPHGFALLAEPLEALPRVRLLLGVEPPPPAREARPLLDRAGERLRRALEGHTASLEADRDLLGFELEADRAARRLIAWLDSGRVEVRRYERGFLHGKVFLARGTAGLVAGSANLTQAGLAANEELDLAVADAAAAAEAGRWFERLWAESVPFDLAGLYRARYAPHPPYLVYLRMLLERYGAEVEEEAGPGAVHLTTFQQDGVLRARRILARHHGVLVADGVGLGKTFIAGALIAEAVRTRRQRVLVVAPAALRDGPWRAYLAREQLGVECLSYEELSRDRQLNPEAEANQLRFGKDEYALVVVDEAQAYRNPDTLRARVLRRLLEGSPPKDLVLLTATPVNNSLWDLYQLLTYFVKSDAAFASAGVRSLKAHFEEAMARDPDDLSPRHLFDVLDEVAVRRTRQFVKRYYPGETVRLGDEEVPIAFPEPVVRRALYDLDEVLPGFFARLAHALDCSEGACRCDDPALAGEPVLTLARYVPSRYARTGAAAEAHEVQLAGLLRSALLKRFESSAHAFACTCRRMAASHEAFLDLLAQGWVVSGRALAEWQATDSDEFDPAALDERERDPAEDYDVEALARDVARDRELLLAFAGEAEEACARGEDPKLLRLAEVLAGIARQAEQDRPTDSMRRDARKTIVFTYFADTAAWIAERLPELLARRPELAPYQGRLALVTGSDRDHAEALWGFAPRTTEPPPGREEDRYDLLVATDVLAEGVNLQQARNIVNYDLPWNPMRLVQRHGRIDRIGSPHERVFLYCFFPDRQLDELLGLEERLERKIAQAAASVGLEGEVLPGSRTEEVVFAETREEIRRLLAEQVDLFERGGGVEDAYSGEVFRQELRRALEPGSPWAELVRRLPWGSGSGLVRAGAEPGFVFCARVAGHDKPLFRYVGYGDEDEPRVERETLACLARAACGEDAGRALDEATHARAYEAWAQARADILAEWNAASDPRALQARVPRALREAADLVRRHPPADLTQEEVEHLLDTLEAPWGPRIQRLVRGVVRRAEEDPQAASRDLAALVAELGLEPPPAAEPLPVIGEEDVHLVCWLAVAGEGTAADPALEESRPSERQ